MILQVPAHGRSNHVPVKYEAADAGRKEPDGRQSLGIGVAAQPQQRPGRRGRRRSTDGRYQWTELTAAEEELLFGRSAGSGEETDTDQDEFVDNLPSIFSLIG